MARAYAGDLVGLTIIVGAMLSGELVPQLVRLRGPCDDAAGVVSLERGHTASGA